MQKGKKHHETKLIALNYADFFKETKKQWKKRNTVGTGPH